MEVLFQQKEESKRKQEEEFLKLSKTERFAHFVALSEFFLSFPSKKKREEKNNNYTITIYTK